MNLTFPKILLIIECVVISIVVGPYIPLLYIIIAFLACSALFMSLIACYLAISQLRVIYYGYEPNVKVFNLAVILLIWSMMCVLGLGVLKW